MAKTAIGLDITPSSLRAAQVRVDSKSSTVVGLAEQALFPGIVTTTGVADPGALSSALQTLWSTFHIKGKDVILGVGGQRVLVRTATVPWMPPKDIKGALALYVADAVPFDVNAAVLDYVISGETTDEEGNRLYTGLLSGAPEEYLSELIDAIHLAGLTVTSVDVNAYALLRAVIPPIPPGYVVAEAVVYVGHQTTQVVVHVNGRPELVRDLGLGSDAAGGAPYGGVAGPDGAPGQPAMPPAQVSIEPLVEEILTTLGFYQSSDSAMPLQRVLLVGSGSQLPGLDYAISSGTNLPVAHDAAWLSLPRDPATASDDTVRAIGTHMAVAVGLGLGAAL